MDSIKDTKNVLQSVRQPVRQMYYNLSDKKKANKSISFRPDFDVLNAIEELAKLEGKSLSLIINSLLRKAIKSEIEITNLERKSEEILFELTQIKQVLIENLYQTVVAKKFAGGASNFTEQDVKDAKDNAKRDVEVFLQSIGYR